MLVINTQSVEVCVEEGQSLMTSKCVRVYMPHCNVGRGSGEWKETREQQWGRSRRRRCMEEERDGGGGENKRGRCGREL